MSFSFPIVGYLLMIFVYQLTRLAYNKAHTFLAAIYVSFLSLLIWFSTQHLVLNNSGLFEMVPLDPVWTVYNLFLYSVLLLLVCLIWEFFISSLIFFEILPERNAVNFDRISLFYIVLVPVLWIIMIMLSLNLLAVAVMVFICHLLFRRFR